MCCFAVLHLFGHCREKWVYDLGMERDWEAKRAILHADLDCFFAAVEILDNPSLKGQAVVVGGTGPRGVVAAASYEARIWGVRSAMPMVTARRLCPMGVFLDGNRSRYIEISHQFHSILNHFTDAVEPIGLDEAFVDVSGAQLIFGTPQVIALSLRELVQKEVGLSVCVGVGTTKQIAKLASRRAKPSLEGMKVIPPRGVVVVPPGSEQEFLDPLSVSELWGVGPKTHQRLRSMGVESIKDLRCIPAESLKAAFGKAGIRLHALAKGIDGDRVVSGSRMKSISIEQTYPADLTNTNRIDSELVRLTDSIVSRMTKTGICGKTITLKIRFRDFRTITRSSTFAQPTSSSTLILRHLRDLLPTDFEGGIRLLGVALSNLGESNGVQLTLDAEGTQEREESLHRSVAQIRERFGSDALAPASLLERGKIKVREIHQDQWGPTHDENL